MRHEESPDPRIPSPDRFSGLTPEVKAWLSNLRAEDLEEIDEAREFMKNARVISKFSRWVIITVVATFVGMVSFGKSILDFWHWWSAR